jgi:raffinose/stachyose/melibiose transport system permease protein
MRAYFLSLPKSIEEAALVDGCNPISAFFRVVLPISKPAYATVIIFTGLNTWNEYFMSSILIRSEKLQTLPIGLVSFIGQYQTNYPQLFASLSIMTVPIVIIYILGQKQFIEGLTKGAIKG